MGPHRIPALALAADLVAVVVFAAVGRASHAEAGDVLGLITTAAPFALGAAVARVAPLVRAQPAALRAGAVVIAGTAAIGLLLRFAFTDRLPWTFALVTVVSLVVLQLGWRGLAALVAHRASQHVR